MLWFDGLDLPTVIRLDAVFFEQYQPDELQPVRGHNISEAVYGGRATLPHANQPGRGGDEQRPAARVPLPR